MRNFALLLLLWPLATAGFSTTWIVSNSGFTFSPGNITITEGDSVLFDLDGIHTSLEVSQVTWNANGNTPLPGGWDLGMGGGLLLPSDLTEGMHWYVCEPHASSAMKGTIMVEGTTSFGEPPSSPAISINPNPTNGYVALSLSSTDYKPQYHLDIFNILGDKVYAAKSLEQDAIIELNLTDFAQGIYLVRFYDGVYVNSRKLVIQ